MRGVGARAWRRRFRRGCVGKTVDGTGCVACACARGTPLRLGLNLGSGNAGNEVKGC